jgi:hypothetical protein
VMSSCDIPITASNISYILKLPTWEIATLSNFSVTYFLTYSLTYLH